MEPEAIPITPKHSVKIAFALLGIIASLFVLELLARFVLPKPQRVMIENINSNQKIDLKGNMITVFEEPKTPQDLNPEYLYYLTDTGMRLKSNMKATWVNHYVSKQDVSIVTNSLGYRYPELEEKKPNEYRILTLGDSITQGDYVKYEDTYPYQIEQNLKTNIPSSKKGKDIKVINAGVGSIGIENELAILQETGLSVKPDIVLLQLYLNDAKESLNLKILRPPSIATQSYLIYYLYDVVNKKREMDFYSLAKTDSSEEAKVFQKSHSIQEANWVDNEAGFNKLIYDNFDDWGYAWSEKGIKKMKQVVTLMNETALDNNTKFVVVLFPVRYQVETTILKNEPQQQLQTILDDLDILNFDLLPALREKYQQDNRTLFYDHCHYNPEGNAFVGKKISEFLTQDVIK